MRLRTVLVCLLAALVVPSVARGQDPVYDAVGSQYGRGFFAPLPFERIDTVTGNLFLSFTDLSLPGYGGLDLNVVRTYNSRDGRWRIGLAGVPLRVVYNGGLNDVDFLTADGAKHKASGTAGTTLTQGFWRFTKATRKLEMPNGLVLTYLHEPSSAGAYLTEIRDPFDNVITLTWQTGQAVLQSITQYLGQQSRVVTFANWADDMASDMSFNGQTWTYTWQTISGTPSVQALQRVDVPGDTRWVFTYLNDAQNAVKMEKLTTPNGGTVTYEWGPQDFPITPSQRIVIQERTTGGGVDPGTWSFNWQDTGRLVQIIGPGPQNAVEYRTVVIDDVPVRTERKVLTGGAPIEEESLTYETLPHPINPVPVVKTVTLIRSELGYPRTYTTTYTYSTDTSHWSNYGQPTQIVESGALTRTTDITYTHNFTPYIRGRVESKTVTVNGTATTTTLDHDNGTGFLKSSSSSLGTTITYEPTAHGAVGRVIDPMGKETTLSYSWGVADSQQSYAQGVLRGINVNGTVAWEQPNGAARTNFTYDGAGRVKTVASDTPGRQGTVINYNVTNHQWTSTTVTRGSLSVITQLDGFGRPIHTQDSAGVQTRRNYNAAGDLTYQSGPYGGVVSEVGDVYTHDQLHRLVKTTRPDGSWTEWIYGPDATAFQESINGGQGAYRMNVQGYEWFRPGDGLMVRLADAEGGQWKYDYTARGQLAHVEKLGDPSVPDRWFGYDANARPNSVAQPESGAMTQNVNAVGNVVSTTDAANRTITYLYDNNHRVWQVLTPQGVDDVATTYDTAGRVQTVTNATVATTIGYDTSSRVTGRSDVILGHQFAQEYFYNAYDSLIQVNYPLSARKVFYDYDAQQRLNGVRTQVGSGPVTQLADTFVYRGDGKLASYRYGNNQLMQVGRDVRQRPTTWQSGPLSLTYGYDHVSNVTSIADGRGAAHSSQYTYDLLDRLKTVTGFGATTYDYTPGGDRWREGSVIFHIDAPTRRLMSLSGGASGSFSYDAVGNMTSDPSGIVYTYTAFNQQKTSTLGSNTTQYQYGGDGMRAVRREPNGTQHLYVYGPGGGPLGEYKVIGGGPQVTREYVYLGSQLLASFAPSTVAPPPLSVAIATPGANHTVTRGQTVQLSATATVGSGLTVSRVEYYSGGLLVGQATTGTYAVTMWTDLLPTTNVVIARVVANNGQAVASTPITITVQ